MADFFAAVLEDQADVHALWLTPSGHEIVRSLMRARGVSDERYSVVAAESQEVSSYLSAADAGLAFIKPCFSKLASSPTKNAEYLACGLSLIINANVGDSDALITEEGVGQLLEEHSRESYVSSLTTLRAQTRNLEETRRHSRSVAERLFNVSGVGLERYSRLYSKVLNDRPAGSISPKLLRNAVDDVWIDALCSAGYARDGVRSFVKITHYILRGMALASVFQPRRSEFPALLEAWSLMAQRELKRESD